MEKKEKKKKQYWSCQSLLSTDAQIMMALGEKGNGKSYDVKKTVLENCWKDNCLFAYFRRYRDDIKDLDIKEWLADMVVDDKGNMRIRDITGGEWTYFKIWRGEIYLARDELRTVKRRSGELEEVINTVKGPLIGKAFFVSHQGYQHTASHAYVNYRWGIYEEFITTARQNDDEPEILMKMISTIFRDRDYKVFLLGNRISRHNPYFRSWGLTNAMKQKPGTIDIYKEYRYDEKLDQEIETVLAIEQCPTAGSSARIFGNIKNSILGDKYDVRSNVPLFREKWEDYIIAYEVLFRYSENYIMRAMINKKTGNPILVVGIYKGQRQIKRILQNEFSTDPMITRTFNPNVMAEKKIIELIRKGKVCYLDPLTGTEFPEVFKSIGGIL